MILRSSCRGTLPQSSTRKKCSLNREPVRFRSDFRPEPLAPVPAKHGHGQDSIVPELRSASVACRVRYCLTAEFSTTLSSPSVSNGMLCYDSGDSNSQPYFTAALVCSRWVQLSSENLTDPELGALDILGCRRANFKRAICIRAAAMAAQPLINHDGLQQTGQRT